jgi:hypothetical protein
MRRTKHKPPLVRLAGGPRVPEDVRIWFEKQQKRIAEIDVLPNCTIGDLLTRVSRTNIDLSRQGIEAYKRFQNGDSQ